MALRAAPTRADDVTRELCGRPGCSGAAPRKACWDRLRAGGEAEPLLLPLALENIPEARGDGVQCVNPIIKVENSLK